jgi:hypothetical protein
MAFKYESIVPWGRSFEEYVEMFGLAVSDLDKRILGCGDGPASFNSIMTKNNKNVVSIDPIYGFTAQQISHSIGETFENVISQTRRNQEKFVWEKIKNVDELGAVRMNAMKEFLIDFESGKKENRYIVAELPKLPFDNGQFDIALSSHFLFLYTDNLSLDFHFEAIDEMCRVSGEVRIFPLLDMNANTSKYLGPVEARYVNMGFAVEEVTVDYEFQKGGNKMLRIRSA